MKMMMTRMMALVGVVVTMTMMMMTRRKEVESRPCPPHPLPCHGPEPSHHQSHQPDDALQIAHRYVASWHRCCCREVLLPLPMMMSLRLLYDRYMDRID